MRLALSSAASPGATLPQLAEACVRRGLEGIFLCGSHAQAPVSGDLSTRIVGVESRWPAAAAVGGPVVVPAGEVDLDELPATAARCERAGARLLIAVPTDAGLAGVWRERLDTLGSRAVGLAWEVVPDGATLRSAGAVLEALRPHLSLVRLFGGGPEALGQTGLGVGPLMAHLALARFTGDLVIGPSRPELVRAWEAWLRRRAGTGCGSAAGTTTLQMGETW